MGGGEWGGGLQSPKARSPVDSCTLTETAGARTRDQSKNTAFLQSSLKKEPTKCKTVLFYHHHHHHHHHHYFILFYLFIYLFICFAFYILFCNFVFSFCNSYAIFACFVHQFLDVNHRPLFCHGTHEVWQIKKLIGTQ